LGFGVLVFITTILFRKQYANTSSKSKIENQGKSIILNTRNITIYGSLKKEFFHVDETKVVYVKSENNYVCIFYFEENILKEKLLRSTLTNIETQLPFLSKIHRSYLINSKFILSIKGGKQNAKLYLKNVNNSIPISKAFFETLNKRYNSPN